MRYDSIEQIAPWCALNKIFGFNPALGLRLAEHFGGAGEVFRADKDELALTLKPNSIYWPKINRDSVAEAGLELQKLEKDNCRFLCIADERYPELLRDCHDAPAGLYIKSSTPPEEVFNKRTAIGVIGTRDITSYGTEWCTKIVAAFSRAETKPMIVSGLALGTDITAHNAALDNGLPTIAVLPTGIDTVYPFRHGWAAEKIADSPGSALVTDYPPGTVPKAINFLRRNRIIAGLSESVILIESRTKGGGLMTCRLAYSYNRGVFALPGRIDDTCSGGCNSLIREKMAEPVIDIDTLVSELGLGHAAAAGITDIRTYTFRRYLHETGYTTATSLATIAETIRKNRDMTDEDISALTGIDYGDVVELTGRLACDGIITSGLLGNYTIDPAILS